MKKINIRESLLQFDKDTSCQYDLTSLYEACALDEEDKKKLVQYIDAKDIDATNKLLTNRATEQGFMENLSDDVSDDELASFGVEKETLTEDTDADTIEQKIKDKTFDALLKKYDEEFVHDYCEVQVGEVGDNIQVRVNAEVSYSDLEDLGTELTKVITEFDPNAYFEPECPGRLVAYIRKDQSEDIVDESILKEWTDKFNAVTSRKELFDVYNELVKVRDNINSGTLMAIYYLVDDKIDEFPEEKETDDIDFDSEVTFDESLNEAISINVVKSAFNKLKKQVKEVADVTGLTVYVTEPDWEKFNGENIHIINNIDLMCDETFETEGTGLVDVIQYDTKNNEYEFDKEDLLDYLSQFTDDYDDEYEDDEDEAESDDKSDDDYTDSLAMLTQDTFIYDGTPIDNPHSIVIRVKKVIVKDGVTAIGDYAFCHWFSLKTAIIPDSVTSIGNYAFDLTGLESVMIPDSVTSIGNGAFYRCKLKSVTIPNSVTHIGENAFGDEKNRWASDLKIKCNKDSYAYKYAEKNNIPVQTLNESLTEDVEVIYQKGNKKIVKDGYGYAIDDGINANRFYVTDDGKPKFDYGCNSKFWLDKVNSLIKAGKLNSGKPKSITEDTPEKYEFTYNEPEFDKFTVGGKDVPYTSHEEAKAHMKEDYPMESFIDELVAYMKGNDLYYSPYVNEEDNLVITVEDGDWKHEHLYLDRLIGKFFFNRGLIVDVNSEVIESDDLSDCYSAHHIYELKDLIFSMSISESIKITPDSKMKEIDIEDKSETGDVGHPIKVGLKDPTNTIDEGFFDDMANVGKAVAKEVKNSKTFQKHVQPKVDKVKNSDAYKNISNAVKDTDTYKNVKQGIDNAKDVVKSNVADKNRKATDISFNVDGKDYRASELKYKLNGKDISADEVAKMNAFQRRKVEMEVPEGVKPIKEGVASATQMNWDDDDDFTYDAEVWEDDMGVVSNKDFFAEGSDYTWVKRVSSVETLDFDNWAVWSALNQDTGETEYFVVEEDTEFIDWGPVDTEQEAKEFLQSKVNDYNLDESIDTEVSIDSVIDAFKVNGPHSRQDKIPEAIDTAFNIINIKDNMRPKSYQLDRVDDNIQFTWVTQEPFKLYDLMLFEKELIRAFTEIAKSVGYDKEFTVMYDITDRDGEDRRVDDIIINGSVDESLDEAWVMSLSDATKDLNDADKNGFYKVMDNITCDPSKCPLDQLENEVGEISARYTDGNASPEYEGEDFADEEYSGSKIYNAILRLYGRENELSQGE